MKSGLLYIPRTLTYTAGAACIATANDASWHTACFRLRLNSDQFNYVDLGQDAVLIPGPLDVSEVWYTHQPNLTPIKCVGDFYSLQDARDFTALRHHIGASVSVRSGGNVNTLISIFNLNTSFVMVPNLSILVQYASVNVGVEVGVVLQTASVVPYIPLVTPAGTAAGTIMSFYVVATANQVALTPLLGNIPGAQWNVQGVIP
jgi:hypothetical protein